MNAFDLGLCVLAALLVLYGLWRGLLRILFSAASLAVAFVVANVWHEALARHWAASGAGAPALRIAAWSALFAAVLLAGGLLGWLAGRLLAAASLGWADRLAGGMLGLLTALLAAAVLALPLAAYGGTDARLLRTSRLAPYVTAVSDWINIAAPEGIARRYERASASLKRTWRGRG